MDRTNISVKNLSKSVLIAGGPVKGLRRLFALCALNPPSFFCLTSRWREIGQRPISRPATILRESQRLKDLLVNLAVVFLRHSRFSQSDQETLRRLTPQGIRRREVKLLRIFISRQRLTICLTMFFAFSLSSCTTSNVQIKIKDPTEISRGDRNGGKSGRFSLLSNSVFSFSNSYESTKTLIPINPICLNPLIKGRRSRLLTVDMKTMVLALYPADRRSWTSPIIYNEFKMLSSKLIVKNRGIEVDISSIPDGRYHMLLCSDEVSCSLPIYLKNRSSTDKLGNSLTSRKNQKYRFLGEKGIFASDGFSQFLESTIGSGKGIIGAGANVWVEQGLLVWPKKAISVWNGRLTPLVIAANQSSFKEANAVPPIVHVIYGKGKRGLKPGFCFPEFEPLVIDLEGRGASFSDSLSGILADLDQDGQLESVAWPKTKGIGFLMIDLNQDGKFSGMKEIISTHYFRGKTTNARSGFDILRSFDKNKDGVFDNSDGMYKWAGLWRDNNGDGKVDPSETKKLEAMNIDSISLNVAEISESDRFGNSTYFRSVVRKKSDKKLAMIYSIKLQVFE